MKLVFCGTPDFAVPTLNALVNAGHTIELVVTQPDRPSGRGRNVSRSAVKRRADELNLPLSQPDKLKNNLDFKDQIERVTPDAIVVVAYGRIIPPWMLNLPRLGNLNVHASLLPKYRGAAPIQWAIAKGEKTTGVTIMRLDEGLDTGPVLLQQTMPIDEQDTSLTLTPRLAELGAHLMVETLEGLQAGTLKAIPQSDSDASQAPVLKKEDGFVDFSLLAEEVNNRIRGFQPWPGVYCRFRGRNLQIITARAVEFKTPNQVGTIRLDQDRLFITCAAGTSLEVLELQPEGKKRMSVREFINGYRPRTGECLAA